MCDGDDFLLLIQPGTPAHGMHQSHSETGFVGKPLWNFLKPMPRGVSARKAQMQSVEINYYTV